ncbi:alpha/beta hydrolase fold domain-containing protein [Roseomonas sp. WA12]
MTKTTARGLRAALLAGTTAGCLALSGMGQGLHAQTATTGTTPATTAQPATAPASPAADMAAVLQTLTALGAKPFETLSPSEARRQPSPADAVKRVMSDRGIQLPPAVAAVQTRDLQVDGAVGQLPARLYTPGNRPAGAAALPLIVYWHGGGWVVADLDTYDATPRALAAMTGAAVLSVHYRQGPENRFPAAHDDAVAAYRWALANARQLGANPERLAVAGESAGGNLALNVAIAARDGNLTRPDHVLAVYPVAGADMNTPSYQENANSLPLSRGGMEWFVKNAFDSASQAQDPRVNLVGRNDLRGLPPVTIVSAQIDPLRSEGETLTARLREAGVDVQQRTYPGTTHEFFGMAAVVQSAQQAQAFAVERLRPALGGQASAPAQPVATNAPASPAAVPSLSREEAGRLIGTNLVGANDEKAGEIENLVADGTGRVVGAVIEWGGFLGIGERRAIIAMEQIQFGADGRGRLRITRDQLEALPRFERDKLNDLGQQQRLGENLQLLRN